jgi:hypothetical protein
MQALPKDGPQIVGRKTYGTTGHLQRSVCRLQTPVTTGDHYTCFQQVQDDMSKVCSVNKDWEFVLKGKRNVLRGFCLRVGLFGEVGPRTGTGEWVVLVHYAVTRRVVFGVGIVWSLFPVR